MKASAVAETPPVISSITPRSHVMSATKVMIVIACNTWKSERMSLLNIEEKMIEVVKRRCRCGLNASCGKKNCSRTSLHTNNSSGKVVNMFNPKQNRATLINVSDYKEESLLALRFKMMHQTYR